MASGGSLGGRLTPRGRRDVIALLQGLKRMAPMRRHLLENVSAFENTHKCFPASILRSFDNPSAIEEEVIRWHRNRSRYFRVAPLPAVVARLRALSRAVLLYSLKATWP